MRNASSSEHLVIFRAIPSKSGGVAESGLQICGCDGVKALADITIPCGLRGLCRAASVSAIQLQVNMYSGWITRLI